MIKRQYTKVFKGIKVRSGYAYSFKYVAWESDPEPTVLIMYALSGINPNTGHQWRFFQGLNLTYVPREDRRRLMKDWVQTLGNTNSSRFTWELIKRKYPYVENAVRRYFFSPSYYITKLREIPFSEMEKVIVSTWAKDFSRKVKSSLLNKFRTVFRNREEFKKTGKFPSRHEKLQQKLQRKVRGEKTSGNSKDSKRDISQGPGLRDRNIKYDI